MRFLLALLMGFAVLAAFGLLAGAFLYYLGAQLLGAGGTADVPTAVAVVWWVLCGAAGTVWAWREDLR